MIVAFLIVLAFCVTVDIAFVTARVRAARKADRRRAQRGGMVRITATPHRQAHR